MDEQQAHEMMLNITNHSVQFSCIQLFATPWITACQASLFITNFRSLPKLMSIESVMPSNHLILRCPLLLLPLIFPSIRAFSNEWALHIKWPEYWTFKSVLPMNIQGWFPLGFDRLAARGTLKSLRQHHSSKASILWHSAFFMVQFSHSYMTTGKTRALTSSQSSSFHFCAWFSIVHSPLPSSLRKSLQTALHCALNASGKANHLASTGATSST